MLSLSEPAHITDVNYNDLYAPNINNWEMYGENRGWSSNAGPDLSNQMLPLSDLDDLTPSTQFPLMDSNSTGADLLSTSNGGK